MLPALNQQLQISTHRFCQIGAAFSIISSKYFACGEKMPKFDVWIVDEGKKLGDKLPGPLFIEDVADMYVGKFIQAVLYQEWKPDVYKWAQRDASVARLKTMTGEEVDRKMQLSSYADPPGTNTVSFTLGPPLLATQLGVSAGALAPAITETGELQGSVSNTLLSITYAKHCAEPVVGVRRTRMLQVIDMYVLPRY
jgi:hypothetical protein